MRQTRRKTDNAPDLCKRKKSTASRQPQADSHEENDIQEKGKINASAQGILNPKRCFRIPDQGVFPHFHPSEGRTPFSTEMRNSVPPWFSQTPGATRNDP
jgi:hypothetical protein